MHSDFQQILKELYKLQRLGIKTGLEHTERLLDACGNPHRKLKFIHVAGTNGKGSSCAMIFSILREAGLNVGLYTSPHLIRFNERIRVNGVPISDAAIVKFMDLFFDDVKTIESTFFETTTAMALWYFNNQKVDYAVIETGLGGRLDSTNVINPEISVITKVSVDHREILGDDIKIIAHEKAGIIKKGIPVISCSQSESVQSVFKEKARFVGTEIQFVKEPDHCEVSLEGTTFTWCNKIFTTSLIGAHQAVNASLGVAAARLLIHHITRSLVNKGLKRTLWPGRFQVLTSNNSIIYDVAHNADSVHCTLKTISSIFNTKPIGLFALKKDKELCSIAKSIKGHFETILTFDHENDLLMRAVDLSGLLKEYNINAQPISRLSDFVSLVNKDNPGLIFGSHYIAEQIFKQFHFSFDRGQI